MKFYTPPPRRPSYAIEIARAFVLAVMFGGFAFAAIVVAAMMGD